MKGLLIDRGTYGTVYQYGNDEAVKIMNDNRNDKHHYVFSPCEIDALFRLSHPNIVTGREIISINGEKGIVMERAENSLRNVIFTDKTQSWRIEIINQIIDGIHYLHINSILHLDLNLNNILLIGENRVVIVDFGHGTVVPFNAGEHPNREVTRHHTRFTVMYRPPEFMEERPDNLYHYSGKSDVWSLGIILYEVFTGKPFFTRVTPRKTVQKNILKDVHLKILNTTTFLNNKLNFDHPIADIIRGCLKIDPKERLSISKITQKKYTPIEYRLRESYDVSKDSIKIAFDYSEGINGRYSVSLLMAFIDACFRAISKSDIKTVNIVRHCLYITSGMYDDIAYSADKFKSNTDIEVEVYNLLDGVINRPIIYNVATDLESLALIYHLVVVSPLNYSPANLNNIVKTINIGNAFTIDSKEVTIATFRDVYPQIVSHRCRVVVDMMVEELYSTFKHTNVKENLIWIVTENMIRRRMINGELIIDTKKLFKLAKALLYNLALREGIHVPRFTAEGDSVGGKFQLFNKVFVPPSTISNVIDIKFPKPGKIIGGSII